MCSSTCLNAFFNWFLTLLSRHFSPARSQGDAHTNLSLAFSVAQRDLGVAKLLDAEDIIDMARPDAKSIQTYVLVLKKALVAGDM